MLLISACLAGENCRMDGSNNLVPALRALVEAGRAVVACPEVLGGLPTPRLASERLAGGAVVNCAGEDVSEAFALGAERAYQIFCQHGCSAAVLKARSPSCGKGCIYDGSFTHTRTEGNGVFAELLLSKGIPVLTEEEYPEAAVPERSVPA